MPVFVTPIEAVGLGYKLLEPIPNSKECKYCKAKLYPIGTRKMLKLEIFKWNGWQKCTCREAVAERVRIEAEEVARIEAEQEALRRAEHQKRVEELFKQSKLGERFKLRTFERYEVTNENRRAYETAKKYAAEFDRLKKEGIGLILNGNYGTGKTHLAAAIANELINKAIPVIFGSTMTLLGKIKESYQGDIKQSENAIIDLYSTVDLLVIDDLGKERVTDWVLEKLFQIVNNRYENNLPLIVTTNYTIDELTKRLSTKDNADTAEAIASRLWEMCRGISFDWDDYRKKL